MISSELLALRRGLLLLIREERHKAIDGKISDVALQGLSLDLQHLAEEL
jgi:NitT/TauT family transport system ATP-binding protein